MNLTKTSAIVLRVVKYGDTGLVADMLTESHGRLSFMVRLSKSGKGKMRKQLFMLRFRRPQLGSKPAFHLRPGLLLPYAADRFRDVPEIPVYDLKHGGLDFRRRIDCLAVTVFRLYAPVIAAVDRPVIRAVLSLLGAVGPHQPAAAVRAV